MAVPIEVTAAEHRGYQGTILLARDLGGRSGRDDFRREGACEDGHVEAVLRAVVFGCGDRQVLGAAASPSSPVPASHQAAKSGARAPAPSRITSHAEQSPSSVTSSGVFGEFTLSVPASSQVVGAPSAVMSPGRYTATVPSALVSPSKVCANVDTRIADSAIPSAEATSTLSAKAPPPRADPAALGRRSRRRRSRGRCRRSRCRRRRRGGRARRGRCGHRCRRSPPPSPRCRRRRRRPRRGRPCRGGPSREVPSRLLCLPSRRLLDPGRLAWSLPPPARSAERARRRRGARPAHASRPSDLGRERVRLASRSRRHYSRLARAWPRSAWRAASPSSTPAGREEVAVVLAFLSGTSMVAPRIAPRVSATPPRRAWGARGLFRHAATSRATPTPP